MKLTENCIFCFPYNSKEINFMFPSGHIICRECIQALSRLIKQPTSLTIEGSNNPEGIKYITEKPKLPKK